MIFYQIGTGREFPVLSRYLIAFGVFSVAFFMRFLVLPLDIGVPFIFFFPGVAVVALFSGLVPSIFYISAATVAGAYSFLTPNWSFDGNKVVPASAFLLSATAVLLVIYFYQRRIVRQTLKLRQHALVFTTTQEGIVITDPQCRIVDANHAFEIITEYSLDEMMGKYMRMLQSGRHDRSFYLGMWQSILDTGNWQGEIWNRRKSGDIYLEWISISTVRDDTGKVVNYVGTSIDMSRMEHAQSELERLAHHDGLTNLPNRLMLVSRLSQAIERTKRHSTMGAVLFLDLDHFKQVNDTLGHKAGDELLQNVASRLKERLRETDTLARLGGDEFVIVLEEIANSEMAATVARQVIHELQTPFPLSCCGEVAHIGGSVGIALFPKDGETATQLIECADQALYDAKHKGRGVHRFFGEAL